MRVAINGFGRIGRSVFRILNAKKDIDVIAINDLFDNDVLAYLLKYDTVMKGFGQDIKIDGDLMITPNEKVKMLAIKDPSELPWKELDIDVVVEATGVFRKKDQIAKHIEAGAKKVVLTGGEPTIRADFAAGMNELLVTVSDKCYRRGHDMIGITFVDGQQVVYNTGLATYTDSVPIIKLDPLPNVITPNGDRFNDFFVVAGIETFDNARLEVYDRWGRLVFETDNYEVGSPEQSPLPADVFDGADLSEGTYFYVVNIDNGECTQSGQLELLRSDN